MTRFIVLGGRRQVGKDTSADIIKKILNPPVTGVGVHYLSSVHIAHFADALKDACVTIFGLDRNDMETEEGKKKVTDVVRPVNAPGDHGWLPPEGDDHVRFMTVREVLQFVGTDLFRTQMDPDVWVKSVFRRKYDKDDIVVVADCRFPNEADFGKQYGLVVKIERNNGLSADTHISERALDNYQGFDLVIDNNSDLVALEAKWRDILREYKFL